MSREERIAQLEDEVSTLEGRVDGLETLLARALLEKRELEEALGHAQDAGSKLQLIVQPAFVALSAIEALTGDPRFNSAEALAAIRGVAADAIVTLHAAKLPDYAKST